MPDPADEAMQTFLSGAQRIRTITTGLRFAAESNGEPDRKGMGCA
jgi:hypothetical protein